MSTIPDAAPAAIAPAQARRKPRWTLVGLGFGIAVLLLGLAVPFVVKDTFTMSLFLEAGLMALLGVGIAFLARHLGLISLGHTAFFGGAAYSVGIGVNRWELSLTAAVGFAVVVGTLLALLMGVLVVRASGMGFLMLTLALSQALSQLALQTSFRPITGAHDGLLINMPFDSTFLGLTPADIQNPGLFWPIVWVSLMVCTLGLWLVGRSRFGIVLEGIRENEERMRFSGYNTFRPRLAAFVLSGAVASLGGALFAINAAYISPDILGFTRAGDSLIAVLIGGTASVAGPLVGTGLFVWAQAHLNFGGNLHMFTGMALIAVLIFMPGGLTGAVQRIYRKVRR
ncbi:branched-chain amino acid transport system permease protein [Nocardioides sp. BE266]|uniref:branched-chain amino acid ABC transporter permease n=1 Tax=Nocardioides sp. BE266 TaxID=2817725 RepID=UPI002860CB92|nr:branched-chain amino acid ABC transporter permease [Nocardioides sp. BE266]MDR7254259.1 branched-chain amino acid transport system permease protein [Nocardioides sp. BE266]